MVALFCVVCEHDLAMIFYWRIGLGDIDVVTIVAANVPTCIH